MDRRLVWALLGAWWVAAPVLDIAATERWALHLGVVALIGLALAPRVFQGGAVRAGMPALMPLLCAASLALCWFARDPRFPAFELGGAALTGWAHVMLFLLVAALVPSLDEEDAAAGAVATRCALELCLGALVLAQAVVVSSGGGDAQGRLAGTLGNPNVLGSVLAAAALALAALTRWNRVALVLAVLLGVAVLATGSRGALAAGGGMALLFAWRRSPRWTLLLVVAVGAVLWLVPNPLTERVLALQTGHTFPRPFLWKVAASNALDHPLGIGPAMNKYVFPPLALHPEFPWLLHQRHAVGLTHNVFLTLTLEWGWLAGAAAVALLAWAVARLAPRAPVDPLRQGAALGAGVLLLELQVDGLEQNTPVFTLALVLGAAALRRLPGPTRGVRLPGRLVAALMVVASLALMGAGVGRLLASWPQRAAQTVVERYDRGAASLDEARAALDLAEGAAAGDPAPARARFLLEGEHLRQLIVEGAAPEEVAPVVAAAWEALLRARAAHPVDPRLAASQADLLRLVWRRAGGGTEARVRFFDVMEELLVLDPLDVEARLEFVREAHRVGARALRREHFEALVAIEPDDAVAWGLWAAAREEEGAPEEALAAWVRCEEAIYNCRVKQAVDNPRSRQYFERILAKTDIDVVRANIARLRRQLDL